jgi:CDP-diacylglycerol--serine O-phosphatidyltransferase
VIGSNGGKIKIAYILPNMLTAISLFLGMLSIIASSKGDFENAAFYIFISLIFDGLDGRVARMTGTTSKFGVEFDSLADLVAFGVAPAILGFYLIGRSYGKFGILVAGLFVIFGAIRLARFNVMTSNTEPNVFIGLPIPAAAVFMGCLSLVYTGHNAILKDYAPVFLWISILVSILMVSNIRFASFKKVDFKKSDFMKTFVTILTVFSFLYLYFLETLTLLMSLYLLSGPLRAAYNLITRKIKFKKDNEEINLGINNE